MVTRFPKDEPQVPGGAIKKKPTGPTESTTSTTSTGSTGVTNQTFFPSSTITMDPFADVTLGGKVVKGSQAIDYLLNLKINNPSEYRRIVNYLKAGGWSGAPENAFADVIATGQRLGKDVSEILISTAQAGYGSGVGTTAESYANTRRAVERYAMQTGISLSAKEINTLANQSLAQKWDAETLKEEIARKGVITDKGTSGSTEDDLRKTAANYGVSYSPEWYMQAAKSILEGKSTKEIWDQQIKDTAKSRYAAFANQIDEGLTPRQIASPYIQSMASILELDPNTITLNDPNLTKALTSVTEEGKPNVTPLWQFERELKQDPRWRYTKNAQEELIGTGVQVLRDFGLM